MLTIIMFSAIALTSIAQSQEAGEAKIPLSANEICPIKVGARIPPLQLPTVEGNPFDLNTAFSRKPTVLIFYRGGWCPFCNLQLSQIRRIHPELLSLGYQVIAVSADRPEKLRESVEKDSLEYLLLSDSKAVAAQALGLAFKVDESTVERYRKNKMDLEGASGERHHILPVPAAFVVGTDGVVKFEYVNPNYRIRINPDVLLAAAKSALSEKPAKL
ncbi:MAG: AhpC/TSA family protein [Ignavibacteriales bacterium]|nr:AhpC/TSA family protein [Ignavibacteriales bacterium]